MFNFSTARVHCSQIFCIMGGSDRKTNLQKWEEMCEELVKQQLRRENMKKKDGPGYAKVLETIERLEICINAMELVKNDPLPLSDGSKSYLSSLYAAEKYGKWSPSKDIGNKYTSKGKKAEGDSIALVSALDGELYQKNELLLENDWLKGTPDIIVGENPRLADKIIDVKTPWDAETFFAVLNDDDLPKQYYWQMQGYMALTNSQVAEVHFCLVNLPDWMLNKEKERLLRNMEVVTEIDPEYVREEAKMVNNLTFDDIPTQERRIVFSVERNEDDIQKIYRQVEKCRPYLEELEQKHLYGVNSVILKEISTPEAETEESHT